MGKIKYPQDKKQLYRLWKSMNYRCSSPLHGSYPAYGGRGIIVCDEWKDTNPEGYINFYNDLWPRPAGCNLDREDNDKGYSKENCRWVTQKVNCNNTRGNRYISFDGVRMTISQWSERIGVKQNTLTYRLSRGWSDEETILGKRKSTYKRPFHSTVMEDVFIKTLHDYFGNKINQQDVANIFGVHYSHISRVTRDQRVIDYYKENYEKHTSNRSINI